MKFFNLICVVITAIVLSCGESNSKNNTNILNDSTRDKITRVDSGWLTPKKINLSSFLKSIRIDKKTSAMSFITISNEFPENWISYSDIDTLITLINSKEKCRCVVDPLSSFLPVSDSAQLGGYAIEFIKNYKNHKKINIGLWSCPKQNEKEAKELSDWWAEIKKNRN